MCSGFDRIAPFYGVFEGFLFGSKLQEMRCTYLDQLIHQRDILLIGEGTGLFLERLLKVNPKTKVTVVEQSAEMMERSRNRVVSKDFGRVNFHKVALQEFDSIARFDAVCTFFFWDCFEKSQLQGMIPLLSKYTKGESLWIDVDFFENQEGALLTKCWHFMLIRMLYSFFALATGIQARHVVEIEPLAKQNGFSLTACHRSEKFPVRARIFKREIGLEVADSFLPKNQLG